MTGTWKFIKNDVVLFSGTFEGNISSVESLESLSLTVTEAVNEEGELVEAKENTSQQKHPHTYTDYFSVSFHTLFILRAAK